MSRYAGSRLVSLAFAAAALLLAAARAPAAEKELLCGAETADRAAAIQACTRMIEFAGLERPDLAKAYYSRATEWAGQGNLDRAIADFDIAVELDPKLAVAYYNRALAWSHKGESDRAIADYDAVLKLAPKDLNARVGRAAEWTAKGEYKRAIADYESAIRLQPDAASSWFGRGRALFYAGDFTAAASDFYRSHQTERSLYAALWLYLARKRADIPGEKTLAQDAGTAGDGAWPAPVVALYLGNSTPEALVRAAAHPDAARQRELRCEASFYIGHWHLLRRAREPAAQLFREAETACNRTFIEYKGAVAELRRSGRP